MDHSELGPTVRLDDPVFQEERESFGAIASKAAVYIPLRYVGGAKIDVVGFEISVLTGAWRILETCRQPLLMEILIEPHLIECKTLLGSLG